MTAAAFALARYRRTAFARNAEEFRRRYDEPTTEHGLGEAAQAGDLPGDDALRGETNDQTPIGPED